MRKAIGWPVAIIGGLIVGAAWIVAIGAALYLDWKGFLKILDGQVGEGIVMMGGYSLAAAMVLSILAIPGAALLALGDNLIGGRTGGKKRSGDEEPTSTEPLTW